MSNTFKEIIGTLHQIDRGGIYVSKRDPRISTLKVYAAKKIDSGLEALLLEIDPRLLKGIDEWPHCEGFHVDIEAVEGTKPGSSSRICLGLCDKKYRTVFLTLAESICIAIESESNPRKAIIKLHDLLFTWQQFLKKHSSEGLSEQARVGLFGELEMLHGLFLSNLNKTLALKGWRGCQSAHQDFQYLDFALEVKTTRAVTPETISISNVRQLDDEHIKELFLCVVNVEQSPSSGCSLQQQVTKIKNALSGTSLELFEEGLREVGFIEGHTEAYERELYSIKSIVHYSVKDGFPRMLIDQVPDGIKGIKYQIKIDSCPSFQVESPLVLDQVKKIEKRIENE
jgi:hypothetical protein